MCDSLGPPGPIMGRLVAGTLCSQCRKGRVIRTLPYVDSRVRWQLGPPPPTRNQTLFFVGGLSLKAHPYYKLYKVRRYMPLLVSSVSQTPELSDWVVLNSANVDRAQVTQQYGSYGQWSAVQMLRSKYCLAPAGDTATTSRIYYAIASGCVPVLITPKDIWASLPFQRFLNWKAFAVFVRTEDFVRQPVESVRAALARANYTALSESLQQVIPHISILHPQSKVADIMLREILAHQV